MKHKTNYLAKKKYSTLFRKKPTYQKKNYSDQL